MDREFLFIAGPCSMESEELVLLEAEKLSEIAKRLGIFFVFKVSFCKANRTSRDSFKGLGFKKGLKILEKIKSDLKIKILTDVHEIGQVVPVAEIVDFIQIPALLSRQTYLLEEVDKTSCIINIKKGQFYAYNDIKYMIEKCPRALESKRLYITERGTTFGYNDLIVDFRSIPTMRKLIPVIFDASHSLQKPSIQQGVSGGEKWLIPFLSYATTIIGIDGLYTEVHINPKNGKCDNDIMIPIDRIELLWKNIIQINSFRQNLQNVIL